MMNLEDWDQRLYLLRLSLIEKWHIGITWDKITKFCPFCDNATRKYPLVSMCDVCLCPPSICCYHSNGGRIKDMRESRKNIQQLYKEIDPNELQPMLDLFYEEIENCKQMIKALGGTY